MEVARHWRLQAQRYRLMGEECPHCKSKIFPPRDVCPQCAEEAKTLYQFSGKGEVYSYSTVDDAPEGYQAPYTVVLVKLAEGLLVTTQLTDVKRDEIEIGMPVEMVTRVLQSNGERGLIIYGYKFRPVTASLN